MDLIKMCFLLVKYLNTYLQAMSCWPLWLFASHHQKVAHSSLISPTVSCPPKHPGESIIHLKAWTHKSTTHCKFWYPSIYPELHRTKCIRLVKLFSSITIFCFWFSPHQSSMHQGISPHLCIFSMVICVWAAHPKFPQTGRKLVQNFGKTQEKKSWMQADWLWVFLLPPQKHNGNCF